MKSTSIRHILAASISVSLSIATNLAQAGEIDLEASGASNISEITLPDSDFYEMAYNSVSRLSTSQLEEVRPRASEIERNSRISFDLNVADVSAKPVSPGLRIRDWDFTADPGFDGSKGGYKPEILSIQSRASLPPETLRNISLSLWAHQVQGAGSWYPWADKRMVVTGTFTREIHAETDYFDIPSRNNLTFNWGISHYVPLNKEESLLLEVGPTGYDSWPITDRSAALARSPVIDDQVHGAGGQIGLIYKPWVVSLNVHGLYEFSAGDRYQGVSVGLNIGKKF